MHVGQVVVLFVVIGLSVGQTTPPYLPNFSWVASGFDSRMSSLSAVANGVRDPIVEWTGQVATPDGKWSVPLGVTTQQLPVCGASSQTNTISGAYSYKQEVTTSVKTSIGIGALFSSSSSVDMTTVVQNAASFSSYYYDSFTVCGAYQITLLSFETFNITDNFVRGVGTLPTSFDPNNYDDLKLFETFFNAYGDSYSYSVILGGRIAERTEVLALNLAHMESDAINVAYEASVSFKSQVGLSTGSETNTTSYKQFIGNSTRLGLVVVGGDPQYQNNVNQWISTISSNPFPMSLELEPITAWFTSEYFPTDPDILSRANAYSLYVQWYFETYSAFVVFNPFFTIDDVRGAQFQATAVAYCPYGTILVSGGCTSTIDPNYNWPWRISTSIPVQGQQAWQCTLGEDRSSGYYYREGIAWAVCSEDYEVVTVDSSAGTRQGVVADSYIATCSSASNSQYWNWCNTEPCREGYVLTGGGCTTPNTNTDWPWVIRSAYPNSNGTFHCVAGEDRDSSVYNQVVSGYGVCTRYFSNLTYVPSLPKSYTIVNCESGTSSQFKNQCSVRCPTDYLAVGGGCGVQNEYGQWPWRLAVSQPQDNGWYCQASEDRSSSVYYQNVYGYAICVSLF